MIISRIIQLSSAGSLNNPIGNLDIRLSKIGASILPTRTPHSLQANVANDYAANAICTGYRMRNHRQPGLDLVFGHPMSTQLPPGLKPPVLYLIRMATARVARVTVPSKRIDEVGSFLRRFLLKSGPIKL